MDVLMFWPLLTAFVLASSSVANAVEDATSNASHAEECRDDCNNNVMLLQLALRLGQTEEVALRNRAELGVHAAAEIEGRRDDCEEEPVLTEAFAFLDSRNITLDQSYIAANLPSLVGIKFSVRGHNLTWTTTGHLVMFQEGQEEMKQNYANLFSPIVQQHTFPDMDFIVKYEDNAHGAPGVFLGEGIPGRDLLTMPRSMVLGKGTEATDSGRAGTGQAGVANIDNPPQCAGERKNLAVFRGSTTGIPGYPHFWMGNGLPLLDINGDPTPRYEAALLSKRRPDLLDAGFTDVAGDLLPDYRWKEALMKEGLWKNRSTYEEQSCYSVILVIDGNTVADRLAEQMTWGLPVVLIRKRVDKETGARLNEEFWYPELVSWKHYVLATSETLETVLETLLADADLRMKIGQSGQQFIRQRLSAERLACYNLQLLSLYGERYHS